MDILIIGNGSGLSDVLGGSLVRTIEILKRIKNNNQITFLTTIGAFNACKRAGLDINFEIVRASFCKKEEKNLFDRIMANIISTFFGFVKVSRLPKYDIVCVYSDYLFDVLPAIFYKRLNKTPLMAMIHHKISIDNTNIFTYFVSSISSFAQKISIFLLKCYAEKILVLRTQMGENIKEHLISKGIPPERIEYVLNGADIKKIKSFGYVEKTYEACFLGGLRPNKGLYDIVPIWKRVCEFKKDSILILIGEIFNVYLKELRDQISKNNLEKNIKILGFIDDEENKYNYIKQSRVFVFPSHEEGFGISIIEAMACGLPVVAWDLPVYDWIFSRGMIRINEGDISAFSNTILKLLDDVDLFNTVTEEAIEVASSYEWDKIAKEEELIMENIIKSDRNIQSSRYLDYLNLKN